MDQRRRRGWLPGVVKKVDDDEVDVDVVDDDGNTIEAIGPKEIKRRGMSAKPVDDLISLAVLHEPAILHALRRRYASGETRAFNGAILIAVNPFQWHVLWTTSWKRYAVRPAARPGRAPGYVTATCVHVADAAYRSMSEAITSNAKQRGQSV